MRRIYSSAALNESGTLVAVNTGDGVLLIHKGQLLAKYDYIDKNIYVSRDFNIDESRIKTRFPKWCTSVSGVGYKNIKFVLVECIKRSE